MRSKAEGIKSTNADTKSGMIETIGRTDTTDAIDMIDDINTSGTMTKTTGIVVGVDIVTTGGTTIATTGHRKGTAMCETTASRGGTYLRRVRAASGTSIVLRDTSRPPCHAIVPPATGTDGSL